MGLYPASERANVFGEHYWFGRTRRSCVQVGIVGAGVTGLALLHYLRRRGVEAIVLEADDEPGGVIRSVDSAGTVLDLGPQRTRLDAGVRDLVEAVGLEERIVEARNRELFVYRSGELRLVPTTLRAGLETDLVSWRGKLRTLLEPLTGPPRVGESVAAFFERTLGPEVGTFVAGPLYGGLYGTDPADMPAEYSIGEALKRFDATDSVLLAAIKARWKHPERPPVVSFDDGMQALPNRLYERYEEHVELDTPVDGVTETRDGLALEAAGTSYRVDRVVLTTPAPATASILAGTDPPSARLLRALNYNPMVVVHLRGETDLRGAGYQIPFDAPHRTLGVTWNASLFGRDRVYTSYLGGSKAPELLDRSDDHLGRLAAREFEAVTGYEVQAIHVARLRPGMPAYDRSWSVLRELDLPSGVHLCANYESRAGIPGRVREAKRLAGELAGVRPEQPTAP